jgi:hypothetical protein
MFWGVFIGGGINWRLMGGMIETITAQYSLSTFFLILQ